MYTHVYIYIYIYIYIPLPTTAARRRGPAARAVLESGWPPPDPRLAIRCRSF